MTAAPAMVEPRRNTAPTAAVPLPALPDRDEAARWIAGVHDELTALFTRLDGGGTFEETRWERPGGGGGNARLLVDGPTFEKAGINRSIVEGALPPEAAGRLGGLAADRFYATGVSMVVHPRSPFVPTFHMNVRYFELALGDGAPVDRWVAGGLDLTPTWPVVEDARHFHQALRATCDAHHASLYPRYKRWCDEYFTNLHRGGEARGVGGLFFDHLRGVGGAPDSHPAPDAAVFPRGPYAFVRDVAQLPATAYAPIVERQRAQPYGERERRCQLARRGRYVEFNLLHDRGTLFGLQTGARVDSVLMSMPPLAAWPPPGDPEPGSPEAELRAMLAPRDWAGATT